MSSTAAVRYRRPSLAVFVPDDEYLIDFVVAKSGSTLDAFLASSDSWAILANHIVRG
jgi:hypothetical protein